MAYVDYEYYKSINGDTLTEEMFNRLLWEAEMRVDDLTTGVDGVRKLKVAFPDGDDGEAVKRCICKLIEIANQIDEAEERARKAQKLTENADGTVSSAYVSSRSSGSESMSFATGNAVSSTVIDSVLADKGLQKGLYNSTIMEYLHGRYDLNGVPLLMLARYPMEV